MVLMDCALACPLFVHNIHLEMNFVNNFFSTLQSADLLCIGQWDNCIRRSHENFGRTKVFEFTSFAGVQQSYSHHAARDRSTKKFIN